MTGTEIRANEPVNPDIKGSKVMDSTVGYEGAEESTKAAAEAFLKGKEGEMENNMRDVMGSDNEKEIRRDAKRQIDSFIEGCEENKFKDHRADAEVLLPTIKDYANQIGGNAFKEEIEFLEAVKKTTGPDQLEEAISDYKKAIQSRG